jgi:transposase-like protein
MARRHSSRHPLFRQRWFADDIIITCVRLYLRFKLSYRDLAELAWELGVFVAPSTILRWVIRYVPEFEKYWQAHERVVGDSWRMDETYLKVRGQWVYLYRAVDKEGNTVESYLSRTRDVTAAKAFFRKAFRRHGDPRVITLDGFEPTHAALRRMGITVGKAPSRSALARTLTTSLNRTTGASRPGSVRCSGSSASSTRGER